MTRPSQALVSSSISGLSINVIVPSCRIDLADQHAQTLHARHGTLGDLAEAHHSITLAMSRGNCVATMDAQAGWRKHLATQQGDTGASIFIEHEMALGDMVSCAAEPLLGKLAPSGNLVINCQSTRESSIFGSSNAGRILSEASSNGLGFTAGQRGLVGGLQALEIAFVLGRNDRFSGSALICTGERWIDIYPRILGSWAMLSDGAAAAGFKIRRCADANVWVTNDRVSEFSLFDDVSRERSTDRLRSELTERLSMFIDAVQEQRSGSLAVISPRICGSLGEDVAAELAARYAFVATGEPCERAHFGAANVLINLQRSYKRHWHGASGGVPTGYLVWDCDPSGLFGAVVVDQSAFESVS